MPRKQQRDLTIIAECLYCHQPFSPFHGREPKYCSARCCGHAMYERANSIPPASTSVSPAPLPSISPKTTQPHDDLPSSARNYRASAVQFENLANRFLAEENPSRERWQRGQVKTIIVTGFGAHMHVAHDQLIVKEGRTHSTQLPTVHTLPRGYHAVERIIFLNPTGALTFDAINWCQAQGITIMLLSHAGTLTGLLTPESPSDVRLRRAQYMALPNGRNVVIAQEIVHGKLTAQLHTLQHHPELPDPQQGIATIQHILDQKVTTRLPARVMRYTDLTALSSPLIDRLRLTEAQAAAAYFGSWSGLALRWRTADQRLTPAHFHTVRERRSPISSNGNASQALDPTNAMLNYCYAVLDAECRAALAGYGFDLSCGFLHTDPDDPNELAHDLMELHRPAVDSLLIDFLYRTTLLAQDFTADDSGRLYLHPQLARAVVAACRVPHDQIDASARWLRDLLVAA